MNKKHLSYFKHLRNRRIKALIPGDISVSHRASNCCNISSPHSIHRDKNFNIEKVHTFSDIVIFGSILHEQTISAKFSAECLSGIYSLCFNILNIIRPYSLLTPWWLTRQKSETNLSLYRKKQRRFVSYIAEIPHAARNASEPDSPTAISIASAIQSSCCKNSAIRIFISLPDKAVKNAFNSSLPIHANIEQTNVIIQLLSHKQDQKKHHYNLIRNKSK